MNLQPPAPPTNGRAAAVIPGPAPPANGGATAILPGQGAQGMPQVVVGQPAHQAQRTFSAYFQDATHDPSRFVGPSAPLF
jgi:hypothetical protein